MKYVSRKADQIRKQKVCLLVLKWPYLVIFEMVKTIASSHMRNDVYWGEKFEIWA